MLQLSCCTASMTRSTSSASVSAAAVKGFQSTVLVHGRVARLATCPPHSRARMTLHGCAGKASMVGAVITSQRALLVSVTLRVLAAASLQPGPTSALWVGPALLVTNAAQQVGLTCLPPCSRTARQRPATCSWRPCAIHLHYLLLVLSDTCQGTGKSSLFRAAHAACTRQAGRTGIMPMWACLS